MDSVSSGVSKGSSSFRAKGGFPTREIKLMALSEIVPLCLTEGNVTRNSTHPIGISTKFVVARRVGLGCVFRTGPVRNGK